MLVQFQEMLEAGGEPLKENPKADTIFTKERVLSAIVFLTQWKEGLERVWKKQEEVMQGLQGMEGLELLIKKTGMVKGEYDELLQKVGELTRLLEDILLVVLK